VKNFMPMTPVPVYLAPNTMAPKSAGHGTTVSSFGQTSARTRAFIGLDVTAGTDANPGSPPREAPV
jgi:hypothetical protein